MWSDFENETLIHNHKISKIFKKRYQRASDFHNSLYNFLGTINVIISIISSTFIWINDFNDENKIYILRFFITFVTTTVLIQNYYKFIEISNNYMLTSKNYAKIQNNIEIALKSCFMHS